MHIVIIAGTRPEGIKLAPLLVAARHRRIPVTFVATGQHPRMLHEALAEFGLTPDCDLAIPNIETTGFCAVLAAALPALFAELKPDLVIVQGDTNSAWVAARAAHAVGLPVGHVEAGLRSGDSTTPWPEERNRREIDVLSTLLFAPSRAAAENLRASPGHVTLTGNTGIDAFLQVVAARTRSQRTIRHLLVTCHRREATDHLEALCLALRTLADRSDVRMTIPLHPNPRIGAVLQTLLAGHSHIRLEAPQPYRKLVDWLLHSDLLLTDSGGLQEEAPAIGLPTLVLRDITERPEPIASGNARLIGLDPARILNEANRLLDDPAAYAAMAKPCFPYGRGDASERILDAIEDWARCRALGFSPPHPSSKAPAVERMENDDELDAR